MADPNTPENEITPLDDGGINNDHILDMCDYIVTNMWKQTVENAAQKPPSLTDMKDMAQTLLTIWSLVQEILDLDRRVRDQVNSGEVKEEFFEKFDGFPPDKKDDDEDDDWGDEDEEDEDEDI